ncbi:hypothetical protein ACFQWF_25110 [Methylorubrum suomiense]
MISALGVVQILAWGSSFYLLGVLAAPIAREGLTQGQSCLHSRHRTASIASRASR